MKNEKEIVRLAPTSDADDWTRDVVRKYGAKGFRILRGPATIRSMETPAYLLEPVDQSTEWSGWVEAKYLDLIG